MRQIAELKILSEVFEIIDKNGRAKTESVRESLLELINKLPFRGDVNYRRLIVVDPYGNGDFRTINEAWSKALTMSRTMINRVTILVMPGVYHERLVASHQDYIDVIGWDRDSCVIEYESSYPDCVIHVQGNNSFKHLTIHSTSTASYCVHADLHNDSMGYELTFDDCRIYGGSNAIGYGSSHDSNLTIKNCILKGSQTPVYIHNCPYSNTSGQFINLIDNLITPVDGIGVLVDDAGTGYGATNTYLFINANGNLVDTMVASVLFRPHPGNDQLNRKYIGDDTQIKVTSGSSGNFNEALDFGGGEYDLTTYVTLPANPDATGYYRVGIITPVFATRYNRELLNVTLPGVGEVTSTFGIGAITDHAIEIATKNSACAGRTVSISLKLTIV